MSRTLRRLLVAIVVGVVAFGGWVSQLPPAGTPVEVAKAIASLEPSVVPVEPQASPSGGPPPAGAPGTARPGGATPSGSPDPSGPGASPGPTWPGPPRTGATSATPQLRAALDASLERFRAKKGIPGVSAAIVFPDGSVWQGNAGLADVRTGRPVTSDTAFSVASVSKTFTAALILGLVEDGRLSLDSSVRTYLPAVAVDPGVTVRQLLDHTSGLRDFYFHRQIDKALLSRPGRTWDAATSLRYVGKPYARPGTSWHYSNTNYLLLGMIAEAVGKATVAEQLRDRFLTPLGLDHTWYQAVEGPRGPVARAYRFAGAGLKRRPIDLSDGSRIVPFTSVVTASGAAGSIASTAGDLARWVRTLYGGDALAPSSRVAMVADIANTARFDGAIGYGLGVQAVDVAGHWTLGHSGRFLGTRAAARWVPEQGIAIAVLTNQSRADPSVIVAGLLALALQPPADCLACPAAR